MKEKVGKLFPFSISILIFLFKKIGQKVENHYFPKIFITCACIIGNGWNKIIAGIQDK